jgi:hypothetical protein
VVCGLQQVLRPLGRISDIIGVDPRVDVHERERGRRLAARPVVREHVDFYDAAEHLRPEDTAERDLEDMPVFCTSDEGSRGYAVCAPCRPMRRDASSYTSVDVLPVVLTTRSVRSLAVVAMVGQLKSSAAADSAKLATRQESGSMTSIERAWSQARDKCHPLQCPALLIAQYEAQA